MDVYPYILAHNFGIISKRIWRNQWYGSWPCGHILPYPSLVFLIIYIYMYLRRYGKIRPRVFLHQFPRICMAILVPLQMNMSYLNNCVGTLQVPSPGMITHTLVICINNARWTRVFLSVQIWLTHFLKLLTKSPNFDTLIFCGQVSVDNGKNNVLIMSTLADLTALTESCMTSDIFFETVFVFSVRLHLPSVPGGIYITHPLRTIGLIMGHGGLARDPGNLMILT